VVAAFAVALVAALIVGLIQGVRPFYADSEGYWQLSQSFTATGHFSLESFVSTQRGYFLPLVIYCLRTFSDGTFDGESTAITVFNSVLFALIGAVLVPRLAELAWPKQSWGLLRRLAAVTLLLVCWGGDLNYPLTDFPGLAMGMIAIVAIGRADNPGWMLLAGMAAAAAVNLRPAYLLLWPALAVLLALTWFRQRGAPHASAARRALCVSALVVGFVLVSLPQSLSAHRYFNTWNPMPGATAHLAEVVYSQGMEAQRWDSYERPVGTLNAISYDYPSAKRLLDEQPEKRIKSLSQYVSIVADHPGIMLPLIFRHFINGLDIRYNTIYVENIASGGRLWLRVIGFILVFLALVRLLWAAARRSLSRARWSYPAVLLACYVPSLASVSETRYMLPVEMLMYMLVLAPGWPNPIDRHEAGSRRYATLAILAVAGLAFTAFIWAMVGSIATHTVFPV
jgi:hypothetical protein